MMRARLCPKKRARLNKILFGVIVSLMVLHLCGLDTYLYQENYFDDFTYPLEVNISRLMAQLGAGETPDVAPTNHFPYALLLDNPNICRNHRQVDLLIVVKSLVTNSENRQAIRETWLTHAHRQPGKTVGHVFLVATSQRVPEETLRREQAEHGDVVQGDFLDEYYNNTLKTIMGFHWVKRHCSNAEFVLFVDDDYYISPANVFKLIEADPLGAESGEAKADPSGQWYTGFRFFVLPVRIPFHRFFVSLAEYPYNIFPPFINGGAYVVSRVTLASFYYATLYTVPFRLDDIYIGILAKKIGVEPEHNRFFFPYKVSYSNDFYVDVIACHGYRDPQELRDVWQKKVAGEI